MIFLEVNVGLTIIDYVTDNETIIPRDNDRTTSYQKSWSDQNK